MLNPGPYSAIRIGPSYFVEEDGRRIYFDLQPIVLAPEELAAQEAAHREFWWQLKHTAPGCRWGDLVLALLCALALALGIWKG